MKPNNRRLEDALKSTQISLRINEILECGFRYAKYKMCLRRNRGKADSRTLPYDYLLTRLKEEVVELELALKRKGLLGTSESCPEAQKIKYIECVAHEAGDIISFASMICDKTEEVLDET